MGKRYADGRKHHDQRHIWTEEEEAMLEGCWGRMRPEVIAQRLGVTVRQVRYKSKHMHLGPFRYASDRVEACTIYRALRGSDCYKHPADWLQEHGLQLRRQRNVTRIYWYTTLDRVWEWLAEHRSIPNWERFQAGDLGPEPAWVDVERRIRQGGRGFYRKWSGDELKKLDREAAEGYTLDEIGEMHGRSANAIHHQLILRGKLRAAPAAARRWSPEEKQRCADMAREGQDVVEIAKQLGRPQGSIYNILRETQGKEAGA